MCGKAHIVQWKRGQNLAGTAATKPDPCWAWYTSPLYRLPPCSVPLCSASSPPPSQALCLTPYLRQQAPITVWPLPLSASSGSQSVLSSRVAFVKMQSTLCQWDMVRRQVYRCASYVVVVPTACSFLCNFANCSRQIFFFFWQTSLLYEQTLCKAAPGRFLQNSSAPLNARPCCEVPILCYALISIVYVEQARHTCNQLVNQLNNTIKDVFNLMTASINHHMFPLPLESPEQLKWGFYTFVSGKNPPIALSFHPPFGSQVFRDHSLDWNVLSFWKLERFMIQ